MKKFLFFIVCLSVQHSTFTGCSLCQLEPPVYGFSLKIDLLDKNTSRSLLTQRDSVYYPDSIVIVSSDLLNTYSFAVNRLDTLLQSQYLLAGKFFADTFYFKYLNTKADTIAVSFHDEHKKKCGERLKIIEIDRISLNGKTICENCNRYSDFITIRK